MNEQLRKLYLITTRNSDFITQRTINKYLPLKNDLLDYQSILELNKNLAEVQMTFKVQHKKEKINDSNHQKNSKTLKSKKTQRSQPNFVGPSLLEMYNSSPKTKKHKKIKSNSLIKSNYITIIQNDPQTEIPQNHSSKKILKNPQKYVPKRETSSSTAFQIHQTQLDAYIEQYLHQLMAEGTTDVKKQIEFDRKLFIEKAIQNLKTIIQESKVKNQEKSSTKNELKSSQSEKSIEKTNQSKQELDKKIYKGSKILQKPKEGTQSKIKSKSTQLMPSSPDKHFSNKTKKQETLLPSIKSKGNKQTLISIPNRSIYNSSAASEFITKIGKTFYINELNTLHRTLELEAKNRDRAQRFFKRRLMNIERQYEKIAGKGSQED